MMKTIAIKKVEFADMEISRKTFLEAFEAENSSENMTKYLDGQLGLVQLKKEILNPASAFFFALLPSKKIIGYLKINFAHAQTELKDKNAMEIERIYVLKDYYGKNVGKILFEHGLKMAARSNVDFIWLGVHEKNIRAISFYKKLVFFKFSQHIFKLGKEDQTDILMKLELQRHE